jgi:hexulose-6-phosphate isomerase|tara:strand:+ start:1148 stop:1996 length:849 start_codon:yes stop_codon:yes gene_type:complete
MLSNKKVMDFPIGFMQGRLSPIVNGKIQAFPWDYWQQEFKIACDNGFRIMEWTLDQDRLYDNPVMTTEGQQEIRELSGQYEISISSLTGDCFMQAPFFKVTGKARESLLLDLKNIITSCGLLGVEFIVFPLVDNGRLENSEQEKSLMDGLSLIEPDLRNYSIKIVFESDFPPDRLKDFIDPFPSDNYGINYDIGNSAAMDFDPKEEIKAYGQRILNVHVKDRLLHGTTVPLGQGNADIPKVLEELDSIGYNKIFILQTARAVDDNHAGVLSQFRNQVIEWIK